MYGICEALNTTAHIHPMGQLEGVYTGKCNIAEGSGVVVFGRDLVSIDAMLLYLTDPSKRWVADFNRTSIELAKDEFGGCDDESLREVKMKVGDWFSP